jgi:acyl-CoA synthetase (NDP forming)
MTNYELKVTSTNPAELAAILAAISAPFKASEGVKAEIVMPVEAKPQAEPVKEPEPAVEPQKTLTLPELRAHANAKAKQGKTAGVKELLEQFGVEGLTKLPAERYSEFYTALEAL